MKVVAIGDVHSCAKHLALILKAVEDEQINPDMIVFTGDFTDRTSGAPEVFKILRDLKKGPVPVVLVKGNHDAMAMEAVLDGLSWMEGLWKSNGGYHVLEDYGIDKTALFSDQPEAMKPLIDDLRWLRANTVLYKKIDNHLFIHAGINPHTPFAKLDAEDALWIRKPFLNHIGPFEDNMYVVHGHTVTDNMDIEILNNRCAIDGGAVYGGNLIAAVFDTENETPYPIKVLSVDSNDVKHETYIVREP